MRKVVPPGGEMSNRVPRVRGSDFRCLAPPQVGEFDPRLSVSVVVPAFGRQAKLDLVLANLAAQTYPSHLMEIVVVDGTTSSPVRLPGPLPENTRLMPAGSGGWGRGHAFDVGTRAAEGDVVLWLDVDMPVSREHVEAHLRWHHAAGDLVVLGVSDDALWPGPYLAHLACAAGDMSVSAGLYSEVGGVDAGLVHGADVELGFRLAQAGAVFVPERVPESEHAHTPGDERRFAGPFLANRIPYPRYWRSAPGRQWLVPVAEIVLPVDGARGEDVRATVEGILAGTVSDLRVSLVGPWDDVAAFAHDPRVAFVKSVPETAAPVPFRFTCPAGWVPAPDAIERLIGCVDENERGLLLLALPGEEPSDLTVARFERTAAVARAIRVLRPGEELDDAIDEVSGVWWLDGTEWALRRATEPAPETPTVRDRRAEVLGWQREAIRWRREAEGTTRRMESTPAAETLVSEPATTARWAASQPLLRRVLRRIARFTATSTGPS